eukprot:1156268-Pelagomonas_calceolata.AAC.3
MSSVSLGGAAWSNPSFSKGPPAPSPSTSAGRNVGVGGGGGLGGARRAGAQVWDDFVPEIPGRGAGGVDGKRGGSVGGGSAGAATATAAARGAFAQGLTSPPSAAQQQQQQQQRSIMPGGTSGGHLCKGGSNSVGSPSVLTNMQQQKHQQ